MVRRVERDPTRVPQLLREELPRLLLELKRLAASEPALVLEAHLLLLDSLPALAAEMEDEGVSLEAPVGTILARLRGLAERDFSEESEALDWGRAMHRLFRIWNEDASGILHEAEELLLHLVDAGADGVELRNEVQGALESLPLVFPAPAGATLDLRRTLILAERHRLARLCGELLAREGNTEYAVLVAQDHFRTTGDAIDLVVSLERDGRSAEAVEVARRALASPRSFQKRRLRELLEGMIDEDEDTGKDRETRKTLEEEFLCNPGVATFRALEAATQEDQWSRVRGHVLGHLEKHQKSPTVLFRLFLDEGMIPRADALVRAQHVDPDALVDGARRVGAEHPEKASGWLIFAAFARAGEGRPRLFPRIVRDLEEAKVLAERFEQMPAFQRALIRFRSRYESLPRLLALLDAAGLDQ